MDGESTVAAKTRRRKRAGPRRSTTEMASTTEMPAAEMPAAEMPSAVTAAMEMPSAMATTVAAAMTAAATFRDRIARGRQRGSENKDGNSNPEFRHRTLRRRRHHNLRQRGGNGLVPDYARGNRAAFAPAS
jgi:hypothetical protein